MRNVDVMIGRVEDSYRAFQQLPANERLPHTPEVMDICVYGRATTSALQTLRRVDRAAFNAWWLPLSEWMEGDPLMRYFYELRNRILKEGETGDYGVVIHGLTLSLSGPDTPATVTYQFGATPTAHNGKQLDDPSVDNVVWLYVEALREIVKKAHARFDQPQGG